MSSSNHNNTYRAYTLKTAYAIPTMYTFYTDRTVFIFCEKNCRRDSFIHIHTHTHNSVTSFRVVVSGCAVAPLTFKMIADGQLK